MISRCTCSVPNEDIVFPDCFGVMRGALRCSQACHQRCQTCSRRSQLDAGAPRLVVGAPRLVSSSPWCSQVLPGAPRCSQVLPKSSPALRGVLKFITITPMALLYLSSEIPVALKAGRNALLGSDTLLKSMHLSLHSTSSQTLLEASRD